MATRGSSMMATRGSSMMATRGSSLMATRGSSMMATRDNSMMATRGSSMMEGIGQIGKCSAEIKKKSLAELARLNFHYMVACLKGASEFKTDDKGGHCQQLKADDSHQQKACPQQGDLRLLGPPSGRGAHGRARTCDRRIPADLRADSQATVPPTPPMRRKSGSAARNRSANTNIRLGVGRTKSVKELEQSQEGHRRKVKESLERGQGEPRRKVKS
ncbi:hypothetical protein PoB_003446700 [Plakobranchus ocellatus]|uniref:Uncharacterized protein n=1 Tax=Plakobranchus ocellatus TaxID=259542 RepID=A0AAV4AM09_9GAST|nr:hypothetical protein PoB_003446700 [Plakobranchus ocellatus]